MNPWMKLGLPVGLGLVAAMTNWAATSSKLKPYACVRVASDIGYGDPIQENLLTRFEVRGDLASFPKTFVPWDERALLYGHLAPRPFKEGDLVMWRDAAPHENVLPTQPGELPMSVSMRGMTVVPDFIQVGEKVSFFVGRDPSRVRNSDPAEADAGLAIDPGVAKQIGPFRVLAVGTRTTQVDQSTKQRDTSLTIAAKFASDGVLDEQSDRLLAALKGFNGAHVLGVVLHKSTSQIQRVRPVIGQATATTVVELPQFPHTP